MSKKTISWNVAAVKAKTEKQFIATAKQYPEYKKATEKELKELYNKITK